VKLPSYVATLVFPCSDRLVEALALHLPARLHLLGKPLLRLQTISVQFFHSAFPLLFETTYASSREDSDEDGR
jgi:hypothetical protein